MARSCHGSPASDHGWPGRRRCPYHDQGRGRCRCLPCELIRCCAGESRHWEPMRSPRWRHRTAVRRRALPQSRRAGPGRPGRDAGYGRGPPMPRPATTREPLLTPPLRPRTRPYLVGPLGERAEDRMEQAARPRVIPAMPKARYGRRERVRAAGRRRAEVQPPRASGRSTTTGRRSRSRGQPSPKPAPGGRWDPRAPAARRGEANALEDQLSQPQSQAPRVDHSVLTTSAIFAASDRSCAGSSPRRVAPPNAERLRRRRTQARLPSRSVV
jgi:hypothetical protein